MTAFYKAYMAASRRLDKEAMLRNDYGDSLALLEPPCETDTELGDDPEGRELVKGVMAGYTEVKDMDAMWEMVIDETMRSREMNGPLNGTQLVAMNEAFYDSYGFMRDMRTGELV